MLKSQSLEALPTRVLLISAVRKVLVTTLDVTCKFVTGSVSILLLATFCFVNLKTMAQEEENFNSQSTGTVDAQKASVVALLNWPQWLGPLGNGFAPLATPPIELSLQTNLRWKTGIEGFGHGTPIVWGNRVFLQTAIPLDREMEVPDVIPEGVEDVQVYRGEATEKWKPQRFELICLDLQTGQLRWRRTLLEAMPHQGHHFKGSFASQSVVTDGEHVIAYFGSYGTYCFDLNGRLIWKQSPDAQFMEGGLGEGSSPALHGNLLVIVVDQQTQSYIVCMDKRTGKELWRQNRNDEASNWSTPRIIGHAETWQVLVNGATLRSYNLKTGERLWECGGHTAGAIPIPSVGNGMVINSSGWNRDRIQAIRLGQRGDLTNSEHVVWSHQKGAPYVPTPMLWGKELYVLDDKNFLSCINAIDGTRHYKKRLPGNLNFSASPVGAEDRIYITSEEGTVIVIKRGCEFALVSKTEFDDSFYASPVLVGESVLLRGKKHLYCFGELPH